MTNLEKQYLGKHLLVGLTYLDENEKKIAQIQLHGPIVAISSNTVVFRRNDNNEEFSIPYDKDSMTPSDSELVYTLKSTNKKITGVDLLSTWTIHKSKEE